jgi:hypothetical protein
VPASRCATQRRHEQRPTTRAGGGALGGAGYFLKMSFTFSAASCTLSFS